MKILIADDDAVMCHTLEAALSRHGHEIVVCTNGTEAWSRLQEPDAPKLAFLDWMMPGLEGPEICRRVRRCESDRYTYLILLTIRDDKEDVVAGINSGADDYITKPFDMVELKARLNAAERNLRVHEDLLATQEMLCTEAMKDSLTGALNHTAIIETLGEELARAERAQTILGVALADIDSFKAVNDTHGHLVGDEVLREVVRRMKDQLRPYDAVGRYGGDEFLIVLPDCRSEELRRIAERVRQAVADKLILADSEIRQTVSVGVAATEEIACTCPDTLIRAADEALYAAKRAGRDCVVVHPSEQPAPEPATVEPVEAKGHS